LVEEIEEVLESGKLDEVQTEVLEEYVQATEQGDTPAVLDRVAEGMLDAFPVSHYSEVEKAYIPTMPSQPSDPILPGIRSDIADFRDELGIPETPVADEIAGISTRQQEFMDVMDEMAEFRPRIETMTADEKAKMSDIQERVGGWIDRNLKGIVKEPPAAGADVQPDFTGKEPAEVTEDIEVLRTWVGKIKTAEAGGVQPHF